MTKRQSNEDKRKKLKAAANKIGLQLVDQSPTDLDPTCPPLADLLTWQSLKKTRPVYDDEGQIKSKGKVVKCRQNTNLILEMDPKYKSLVYWEHADQILWEGRLVTDPVIEEMALDLEVRYRYHIGAAALLAADPALF